MTHSAHEPHGVEQSYEKGAHGSHHHGGVGVYVMVAVALVILTSFSYATNLPLWSAIVGDNIHVKRIWMMGVSCTKAMLVILFFMHLKWEANWKWVLTVPASMMSMLLIFALVPDIGRRMNYASHDRLTHDAVPIIVAGDDEQADAKRPAEHPVGE
jgi:cytochrome c oxidase subunit 4